MTTRFDYDRQAWVKDGRYVRCGHMNPCDCYGTAHEGEIASLEDNATPGCHEVMGQPATAKLRRSPL